MGRARGQQQAAATVGTRFDAVMPGGRGLGDKDAALREVTDVSADTLYARLYEPDVDIRRAVATEIADRVRDGEAGVSVRAALWAHCLSETDSLTQESILAGLCDHLRDAPVLDPYNKDQHLTAKAALENLEPQAIMFLTAASWSPGTRNTKKVADALADRFQRMSQDEIRPLAAALLDAAVAAPNSDALARTLVQSATSNNEIRRSLTGLLMQDDSNTFRVLGEAYSAQLSGDFYDREMLTALAQRNEKVQPGSTFAQLLSALQAIPRGQGSNQRDTILWDIVAAHADGTGDGYDNLRREVHATLDAGEFPGSACSLFEHRTAAGNLTALASKALPVAAQNPDIGWKSIVLAPLLAKFTDEERARPETQTIIAACAAKTGERHNENTRTSMVQLVKRYDNDTHEAAVQRLQTWTADIDSMSERVRSEYTQALQAGLNPEETVPVKLRHEQALLVGRIAASDRNFEKMLGEASARDLKEHKGGIAGMRVRKALSDPAVLTAAVEMDLNTAAMYGCDFMASFNYHNIIKCLKKLPAQ